MPALLLCLIAFSVKASPPNVMINRTTWELTQVPNIATETGRIKTSLQVADFEPTGVRATANTAFTVLVEQLNGTDLPKLIVGTYDRQTVTTYTLVAGVNTITNVNGGDLYLQFSSATPSINNKVRVTFQSGYQLMPLYILGSTTHTDWLNQLAADTSSPNVTMISNRVFIVVSRVKAVEYQSKNQDLLLTLMDSVLKAEGDISGLDNSLPVHAPFLRNKLMMVEKASGNPDATSLGRIRIPTGSINWLLDPAYILDSGGWGVFHEAGHHHQQFLWTWSTCTEVTVNIYSLAAKRAIHPTAQGLGTSDWNTIMDYLALPQASKNFNASSVALFTRLGMFHQLWIMHGDSFYHTLHKRIRAEAPSASGDEAEMRLFMLMSCQITGHNLGQFFRNWGLNVSQSIYDELNALGYPQPPVDPSTLREDLVATITSPVNNTVYAAGSNIAIEATSFGPTPITKVEFFQGATLLGTDSTRPYSFNWNNANPGSYTLTAKSTAANNATVTSTAVNITIEAVTLTAPANNTSYPAGSTILLQASAFGTVAKIDFYANGALIGSDNTAPYSFSWQAPVGNYSLTAQAIGLQGDTVRSSGSGIVVGGTYPVADAYVRDASYATVNYGTGTTLVVKKDGNSGFSRISYLKFDVTNFTNPGQAILRLNLAGAGTTITGTQWLVYKCDNDSWTETGITWNTKPDTTSRLGSTPGKNSGYAEWDISNAVATEASGDKIITLAIVSSVAGQTNDASFYSKEAATASLRPVLYIDAYPQITLSKAASDTIPEHSALLLQAQATDDRKVTAVNFLVNGVEKGNIEQAPYQWNLADLAEGSYGIRAKATDNAQLVAWSDSITVVVVKDTIAPQITAPAAITAFIAPYATTATVQTGTATATDNAGIASITSDAPAVFSAGNTIVTYTATDLSGNTATATQLITVKYPQSKFGAVTVFVGASNGNDRRIDLQAQLFRNGQLVATGNLLNQPMTGNGLPVARAFNIPLNSDSIPYTPGDRLDLKILARKAGRKEFKFRLWYGGNDDCGKGDSRMQKYTPAYPDGDFYYLREQFLLSPAQGNRVSQLTYVAANDYQEIGTWSTVRDSTGARMQTNEVAEVIDEEITRSLKVKILPNPSTNFFVLNIQSASTKQVQVIVRNVSGQLVKQYKTTPGQSLVIGNEWKAGVYFAEIRQERESKVIKLVKQ